jgi:hypothetical protein
MNRNIAWHLASIFATQEFASEGQLARLVEIVITRKVSVARSNK